MDEHNIRGISREKKKRKKRMSMRVSGKSIFLLQELEQKRNKELVKRNENTKV